MTCNVDLVVEVAALLDYHHVEAELARLGFVRDVSVKAPICRWRYRGIEVDLMPTEARVLGFANRWYPMAVATAGKRVLPGGITIRVISASVFVATKFEAFANRGQEDLLGSHDLEDTINVIDGRPELADEIARSRDQLPVVRSISPPANHAK